MMAGRRRGKEDRKQNTVAALGQSYIKANNSAHIFLFVFNVLAMIDYKQHVMVTTSHA